MSKTIDFGEVLIKPIEVALPGTPVVGVATSSHEAG